MPVGSFRLNLQLSDFPQAPIEESLSVIDSGFDFAQIANAITIIGGGLIFYTYDNRPRGSALDNLIEVRKSEAIANQLGVFAKTFIPADTVIGTYPGYVKDSKTVFDTKNGEKAIAAAKKYTWMLTPDLVLDPTNNDGTVPLEIVYFGVSKIPTTLSRINEPPPGKDCNCFSRDEAGYSVQIVTEKNIFPGDEIFIDYGRSYDRSDYVKDAAGEEGKKAMKKVEEMRRDKEIEEIEYMKITPIVGGNSDQDTTISDGFLSKLSKKDQYSESSGIISPEEGSKIFSEQGDTMFASDEDKELIDSMMGKNAKVPTVGRGTKKKYSPSSRADSDLSSDDELLKSLMLQIGREEEGGEYPDPDDIFGSNKGLKIPSGAPPASNAAPVSTGSAVNTSSAVSGEGGSTEPTQVKKPVMSPAEAEDLQRRMDAMTDAQIEQLFKKMTDLTKAQLQDDLQKKLTDVDILGSMAKKKATAPQVKRELPKAEPLDKEVRRKYEGELREVEEELEKMYNDPIGVWRDMINKEKKEKGEGEGEGQ